MSKPEGAVVRVGQVDGVPGVVGALAELLRRATRRQGRALGAALPGQQLPLFIVRQGGGHAHARRPVCVHWRIGVGVVSSVVLVIQ